MVHVPGYIFMRMGANGDTPERGLLAKEVGDWHLDHFELVAWRLALHSVLRKIGRSRSDSSKGPACKIWHDFQFLSSIKEKYSVLASK